MLIIFISFDFTNIYSVHVYWRFGSMITELFFFFLKTVNKIYCFNNDHKTMLNPKRWQAIVSSPYKHIFSKDCT